LVTWPDLARDGDVQVGGGYSTLPSSGQQDVERIGSVVRVLTTFCTGLQAGDDLFFGDVRFMPL